MKILDFFGFGKQEQEDPYWEFDQQAHFRPKLSKGGFFQLSGFDFGWFVLEPLSRFVNKGDNEIEGAKALSYGQKALYYWWYLDAQVRNGGFVQFYYNSYGQYMPTIIKGLEHIGDKEMASLAKKAHKVYLKNKKLMDKAQESDLFGSDLYERLDKLSELDDHYYGINEQTMDLIEAYIRKHPNEICLDEEGKDFDLSFTGTCQTHYESGKLKEEFDLESGAIHGTFQSFHENGKSKETIEYIKGKQTGERKEYYENGNLKYEVSKGPVKNFLTHQRYYENGNPKNLETSIVDGYDKIGEYKKWHENGQLEQAGSYNAKHDRDGDWQEFYDDGRKKLEATYVGGKRKLINSWNESGEQTLREGNGTWTFYGKPSRREKVPTFYSREFKNYEAHGVWKEHKGDILLRLAHFENGKAHGITQTYYENGNLEKRLIYEHGEVVSREEFAKFKDPKVVTNVVSVLCERCYVDKDDYVLPDNRPMPINDEELTSKFEAEASLFEAYGDDHVMSYGYYVFVDEKGDVSDVKFAVADNAWLDEEVKASMANLKFEPALKDGRAVKSIHYVRYKLRLTE